MFSLGYDQPKKTNIVVDYYREKSYKLLQQLNEGQYQSHGIHEIRSGYNIETLEKYEKEERKGPRKLRRVSCLSDGLWFCFRSTF